MEPGSVLKQGLNRNVFKFKPGLNKVLLRKTDGNSLVEILGAAEYNNPLKGAYAEEASTFLANFAVTARISRSLFFPLKSDTILRTGMCLGF